ncbi:MAG TPA: Ig-like domain-containing protein [Solirubrobacteraceae bacterium]|nr:Ig-like domain-containing protein [Solirubrobacteraceae bacterium]
MVGSGIGMRRIGRYGTATGAVLVTLALSVGVAHAEPPTVTIATPSPGTVTSESSTTFAGSTNDPFDSVTVVVYEGSGTGGTRVREEAVSPSDGSWEVQASTPLPDGVYTAVAQQGAIEVGFSAEVTFTVDTVAPALSLNAISPVIATATPSFGGAGGQEAGDGPVHVFVDDTPVGDASASGGGWTLTSASLSDGTHTVRAEQSDQAGNVSKTGTASFRVDTTAPAPTVTGPKAGERLKASLVEFHGGAGSATGDGTEVAVEVFKGESVAPANLEQSFTVARSGSNWSAQKGLPDGTHTVRVTQSDSVGHTGASSAVIFTVDTVAPALTLNPIPSVIATATPTFGGAGGQGDLPVHVFVDGSPAGEASVIGGSWTLTSAHLSDGTHTVRAEQADQTGNVAKTGTASFRVDTLAPAPTVTGPSAGDKLKSSLVEFHGGAGSATGDDAEVVVEVFKGESKAAVFKVTRSGSGWSSGNKGPRLSNGTYTVRVTQTDSVGHTGASPSVTFEVASPAPSVTLHELPRFIGDATPSFAGSAEVSSDAKPEVTLKIWRGTSASGSMVESASGAAVGTVWSLGPVGALPDGTYTAQAEQPAVANPAGVSETTTFTVDTVAPQPTLSAPPESTGLETVSGTAGTASGDRRQVTAELFAGETTEGGPIETITVVDNETTGAWTATFAGLAAGRYTVIARQSDEAGNTGSSVPPQTFTVSAPPAAPTPAAPTPPVASFTWLPATPTVGQSVSFVSKSTDVSSPITAFGWDMAGNGPFAPGGALTTATFATAGAHTVRLQVGDALGQSSTVAETVNVAPRTLTLMQPFPIVRIAGAETAGGARIKLLSVQAPPTAKVAVTCKGRGCRTKTETRVVTATSKRRAGAITLAFPRFQRALGAGAVLRISITRNGQIGKFTSFTIRRRKLPVRVDACLRPPSTRPSPCPSQ